MPARIGGSRRRGVPLRQRQIKALISAGLRGAYADILVLEVWEYPDPRFVRLRLLEQWVSMDRLNKAERPERKINANHIEEAGPLVIPELP